MMALMSDKLELLTELIAAAYHQWQRPVVGGYDTCVWRTHDILKITEFENDSGKKK